MLDRRISIGGLRVSPLCLGGNRLGTALDRDASFRLLDAFAELGGNFLDTARIYSDWVPGAERGASERTIGRWLASRGLRGSVVVGTKGGHPPLGAPGRPRLTRADLASDLSASLDALGLGRIPLFYLHRDDPAIPAEEIVDILEDLGSAGYFDLCGASNWRTERLAEARAHAERHGRKGFAANQPEWSPLRRDPATRAPDLVAADAAMLDFHARTGLPMVPYSAQAQGYADKLLAGRLDDDTRRGYDSPENRLLAADLGREAARLGLAPGQALLRRLTAAPFPVIPVVGCRTPEQVVASAGALADRPLRDGLPP